MRSLLLLAGIGLFMVTMFAGCVSRSDSLLPGAPHESAGLTLNVLPETFHGGAEVEDLSLDVSDLGDSLMVDIMATGATNLKALFFELEYDHTILRPMIVDPSDRLGDRDDLVVLQVFREIGVVNYGQIQTHPDLRVGFNGNGVVAKVLFNKEPALSTRMVSTPPDLAPSAQILNLDMTTNVSWWYANQGDYDQNSEVNLADIAPIAINFMESVVPGSFPINSEFAVIDGDGNGEINLADVTPIAINFMKSCTSFELWAGPELTDYPDGGARVDISGAPSSIAFADGVADPAGRLLFSVPIADIDGFDAADNGYWVFPSDGATLGFISNAQGWDDIPAPVLVLTNPPAGVRTGTTAVDAYIADDITDYVFEMNDPTEGDVSLDALTVYTVVDGSAGSIDNTDATLNIEDAFTGTFYVSAKYNNGKESNRVYMSIDEVVPPDGLFIMPDPADADWAGVTGTGADDSNPYVLGVAGGFNSDHSTEFAMVANTSADGTGDVIPNADLTWIAFPPFVVDWTGDGTFNTNMFTSEYIFAQDAATENSNNVHIVHQSLPDS